MNTLFNRFLLLGATILSIFYLSVIVVNSHDAALKAKQTLREQQRQEMIVSEYGYSKRP